MQVPRETRESERERGREKMRQRIYMTTYKKIQTMESAVQRRERYMQEATV